MSESEHEHEEQQNEHEESDEDEVNHQPVVGLAQGDPHLVAAPRGRGFMRRGQDRRGRGRGRGGFGLGAHGYI
jgi:hypothetical protein